MRRTVELAAFMLCLCAVSNVPAETNTAQQLLDRIEKDGITWELSEAVTAGRFVNGDYYVVGPVTVTAITPAPANGRNGSVLNLPVDQGISGFDDRVSSNRFRESLRAYPPIDMQPGDALISSISVDELGVFEPWLREGNEETITPVRSVSVLTCLDQQPAADAFRPSYCDRQQVIYTAEGLRRDLLPGVAGTPSIPDFPEWAEHFRRPWLDVCFFGFDAAVEYQPVYGREVGRSVGIATLMLLCDDTSPEKEALLINVVQYGIDLWGIARAGYPGWQAHGGHGSGRKWPIIFAGLMLGDEQMRSPNTAYPDLRFGEDMQTMYDDCWTGADVVYAGHTGVWEGEPVNTTDPEWQPYEHLPPVEWPGNLGENYRRCCTSLCWVGQALAARIMHAESSWGHDAFFDYVDRWMTEDDSAAVAEILDSRGWDYSADWQRQGQCWDGFVEEMWAAYRNNLPEPVRNVKARGAVRYVSFGQRGNVCTVRINGRGPAILRVYDARGRKIYHESRAFSDAAVRVITWSGRDDEGRPVPAGIYVFMLETDGDTYSWNTAVVR